MKTWTMPMARQYALTKPMGANHKALGSPLSSSARVVAGSCAANRSAAGVSASGAVRGVRSKGVANMLPTASGG